MSGFSIRFYDLLLVSGDSAGQTWTVCLICTGTRLLANTEPAQASTSSDASTVQLLPSVDSFLTPAELTLHDDLHLSCRAVSSTTASPGGADLVGASSVPWSSRGPGGQRGRESRMQTVNCIYDASSFSTLQRRRLWEAGTTVNVMKCVFGGCAVEQCEGAARVPSVCGALKCVFNFNLQMYYRWRVQTCSPWRMCGDLAHSRGIRI